MAFFACRKAALTGTDKVTRANIAKSLVSSRFTSSVTGKSTLRGVVQADIAAGRDVGYVTNVAWQNRLKAAARASKQAGGGIVKNVKNFTKSVFNPRTYSTATTSLHDSPTPGNVGVDRVSALSKKTLVIGAVGVVIALWTVNKVIKA